jgi:enoyl-CoA hydratase/carnithine racemase
MACDIRVAESQAKLALPEATVGLLPCAGGTQRLTQLVGQGWAKRMILCGERISADKALAIGLVEEVVGTGEALGVATRLATSAGAQSPTSIAACKRLIHAARDISIAGGLVAERSEFVALFSTEDQREGVNAFLEKRKPAWKNC